MRTSVPKLALLGALICLARVVPAQRGGPALVQRATQCSAAKHFLPHPKATTMTFGYLLDETSYPGEKVLYVINYPNPSEPDGFVFTVF
ncbi:MAG TPA: hypothetical protein VMF66_06325 [Candidatus Acidoferrum sp.]|nr:hypothetical protein [Candidatus Acidoferrum sp.]